jgi:hypothetical protein
MSTYTQGYVPGQQYVGQTQPWIGTAVSTAGTILGTAAASLIRNQYATGAQRSVTTGQTFPEGAQIDIVSGNSVNGRTRRRRRKLLTCGDKADIAFLYGQLGGGQLGRSAISALLSRRCS